MAQNCKFCDVPSGITNAAQPRESGVRSYPIHFSLKKN